MIFVVMPTFGIFWWLFIGIVLVCLALSESSHNTPSLVGISFVCFLFLIFFGEGLSLLKWMVWHPLLTVLLGIGYVIAGSGWAIFRFYWDQKINLREYIKAKEAFLLEKKIIALNYGVGGWSLPPIPNEYLEAWQKRVSSKSYTYPERMSGVRQYFTHQKEWIIQRMIWWPVSVIVFFFSNFLHDFYTYILNLLSNIFLQIEQRVWKSVEADFRPRNDREDT